MPKKEVEGKLVPIPALKMKYKDIFNLKEFYKALHEWFKEYEWKDMESEDDRWESYYGERSSPGGAKEIWIWWRLYKKAPETEYLNYYLDLDFHVIGLVPTEVIKGGNKIKTQSGEIELKIRGYVELKYMSKFKESAILSRLEKLFTKRIYKGTTERERELYQEVHALYNFVKQWFKLKRYLPYEERATFFPSQAWPSHQKL